MISGGAWWDTVDELAAHQLGTLLECLPEELPATLRAWAAGDDQWLRRAAILAQLGRGRATDPLLLADCIAPSLAPSSFAREFFIAKGIGWALRQHARTDPDWVRGYLSRHHDQLPPLSRREAAKHLGG
jgi:3-methyladenine DNA glycosylase AlkD